MPVRPQPQVLAGLQEAVGIDRKRCRVQPRLRHQVAEARGEIVAVVPIHSLRLQGISAKQEVVLGGESEILSISHETSSVKAYAYGILLSIRAAARHPGLIVGLDQVVALTEQDLK